VTLLGDGLVVGIGIFELAFGVASARWSGVKTSAALAVPTSAANKTESAATPVIAAPTMPAIRLTSILISGLG